MTTFTGADLLVVVPSPSAPYVLKPQHFTPPFTISAHTWDVSSENANAAETAVTPRNGLESVELVTTSTGVDRSVVVPSPNCPLEFLPQHFTPPFTINAQEVQPPAEIAATPLVNPVTSVGVVLPEPVPFSPKKFDPQHFTPPDEVRAHVCAVPPSIATALVKPLTSTGDV